MSDYHFSHMYTCMHMYTYAMLVGRYVLSYVFFASICRISICVYVVGVVCMCMHILYTYACWIVCHMNFPPIRPLSICIYIVVSLFVFVFVCVRV